MNTIFASSLYPQYPYCKIQLSRGLVALVDPQDFEELNQFKWQAAQAGERGYYATRRTSGPNPQTLQMHRVILGLTPGDGLMCDHANLNTLDNRRFNLRIANRSQNASNRRKDADSTSPYKGVYRDGNRWVAVACLNGVRKYAGRHTTAEDAARAYQAVAKELHGEFARF